MPRRRSTPFVLSTGARGRRHGLAGEDDITRICAIAVVLENTALALNLLRDLDEAQRSGNERKLAKVRRRFDRVLAEIAAN